MKLVRGRFGVVALLGVVMLVEVLGARAAHAGAWNRKQWGFYLQLGTAFTDARQRFLAGGGRDEIVVRQNADDPNDPTTGPLGVNPRGSHYQQLLTDLYFELGLLPRLTLIGDIAFASARMSNEGGNIVYRSYGIADLMFGLRVQILQDPVAFALEGRLYGPTGDQKAVVPLGTGDFRGELRLALGKAWSQIKVPVYVTGDLGVMFRGSAMVRDPSAFANNFETEVRYKPEVFIHFEVGAMVLRVKGVDRLLANLSLDWRRSAVRNSSFEDIATFSLVPESQELTTLSGGLMGFIWKGLGLTLRATGAVQGRRTLESRAIFGGVFASF